MDFLIEKGLCKRRKGVEICLGDLLLKTVDLGGGFAETLQNQCVLQWLHSVAHPKTLGPIRWYGLLMYMGVLA